MSSENELDPVADALNWTGPHWVFSLAVYKAPGVPTACILLQDRYGVDVNMLLLSLFVTASSASPLSTSDLAQADAEIRALRDQVVHPLRKVRRAMKTDDGLSFGPLGEQVRNRVKAAELGAEQLEQALLARILAGRTQTSASGKLEDAARKVVLYYAKPSCSKAAFASDAAAQAAVALIVKAADRFSTLAGKAIF